MQLVDQPPARDAAEHGHGAGQRHLHERGALVGRALAQHHEVADVVRHLVREHGEGGDQAQAQVGDEGRGDQDAVAEAVHAVAGEHGPAAGARAVVVAVVRMVVAVRVIVVAVVVVDGAELRRLPGGVAAVMVLVPVVPQLGLVEQEEEHHAEQQHREQQRGLDAAFEGLGQQVHEGGGEQRARRQAQQVLRIHAARAAAHAHAQQQRREPHAADAGDQGRQDDHYQVHSCLRNKSARWHPVPFIKSKKAAPCGDGLRRKLALGSSELDSLRRRRWL